MIDKKLPVMGSFLSFILVFTLWYVKLRENNVCHFNRSYIKVFISSEYLDWFIKGLSFRIFLFTFERLEI